MKTLLEKLKISSKSEIDLETKGKDEYGEYSRMTYADVFVKLNINENTQNQIKRTLENKFHININDFTNLYELKNVDKSFINEIVFDNSDCITFVDMKDFYNITIHSVDSRLAILFKNSFNNKNTYITITVLT